MNWDMVGAIGEIAGALGVIITLGYLSVQLRQNTKASKLTAIQNSMENSARLSELLSTDLAVSDLFWRGLAQPETLDLQERRRFVTIVNVFMRRESVAFYLHKEGTMPDELWESRVASFTGPLNQPGFRMYMDATASTLPADFRDFVLSIMERESTLTDEMRALITDQAAVDVPDRK